ncbi:MAG: hypothetical protein V3T17_18705 [Pseudomonadales bacterium]
MQTSNAPVVELRPAMMMLLAETVVEAAAKATAEAKSSFFIIEYL